MHPHDKLNADQHSRAAVTGQADPQNGPACDDRGRGDRSEEVRSVTAAEHDENAEFQAMQANGFARAKAKFAHRAGRRD